MPFVSIPIAGQWWLEREGTKEIESYHKVRRGSRQLRVRRAMQYEYRTYKNVTDGSDTRILEPETMQLWKDPVSGEPASAEDWMVRDGEMSFDMNSGMVEIGVVTIKTPLDWDTSKVVSRREFL